VKVTLEQVTKSQGRSRALSLTSALGGCGRSKLRPGRFTPGNDPVPVV
jgi:hypothetical protein